MANPPAAGSPEWVLYRLLDQLNAEKPTLETLDTYYWGPHPVPHVPPGLDARYVNQFQQILRQSQANFMQLVIDAMANRTRLQGVRLSASEDDSVDEWFSLAWQASSMQTESRLGFRDAFVMGRSAISVWYGDEFPTIAIEDARQTIVEMEPGTRKRRAALKVWIDDWTGQERANVYLPEGIYKFKRNLPQDVPQQIVPAVKPDQAPTIPDEWTELTDEFVGNKVGLVPIVPLVARPDSMGCGHSEIEGVIAIQERINGGLFNRALAGWLAAFRQKWATGLEIPEVDGVPVEPFETALNRMFINSDPEGKFGTFEATDITQYLAAHEQDVKDIAAITFTPRHFLIQQGQEPSGDAINSADAPLVSKVYDREDFLSEGVLEAARLICAFGGKPEPKNPSVLWADPRDPAVIEAARTDAILKQKAGGIVSTAMAQEKLGYTPDEIARMADDLMAEALRAQAAGAVEGLVSGATPPSDDAPPS